MTAALFCSLVRVPRESLEPWQTMDEYRDGVTRRQSIQFWAA